jgi:TRAP-type C4-dicarboxylate transport system substrate-binding protein
MNLDKWKALTQAQRDLLMRQVIAHEADNVSWTKVNEDDTRRQAQANIQVITFDAAATKQYYDRAYEVAWTNLIKVSPQYGPQLQKLFSR